LDQQNLPAAADDAARREFLRFGHFSAGKGRAFS
jgi:hypothetical protein